jgi:glycosyltransferase involved in cell wall biosynthesis
VASETIDAVAGFATASPAAAAHISERTPSSNFVAPPPRRVLHVAQPGSGGVADYVEALAMEQNRRGWPTAIAGDKSLIERAALNTTPTFLWAADRSPVHGVIGEIRSLRRIINAFQPDVMVLHSSKAGLVGRLALRGSRPTVVIPNAWSFLALGPGVASAAKLWERFATRWTNAIVCVGDGEAELTTQHEILAPQFVITNPVLPIVRSVERDSALDSIGPSVPLVVCIGRICRQKGQDRLLQAWPTIRQRVPNAELYFVGGAQPSDVADLDGVTYVDWTSDTRSWLRRANVVVMPSRWEGLSFGMLEALDEARPVVITDVSGSEVVAAARGGFVVSEDNPAALVQSLAAAVSERLTDPALASAEGERGRRWVLEHHRMATCVDQFDELLGRIESFG